MWWLKTYLAAIVWQKHMRRRNPIQLKRKAVKKAVKNTKSFPNSSEASTFSLFPSIQSLSKVFSNDGNDKSANPGGNCRPLRPRPVFLPPFRIDPCVVSPIIWSSESLVTVFSGIIPGTSTWIGICDPSNFPAEINCIVDLGLRLIERERIIFSGVY